MISVNQDHASKGHEAFTKTPRRALGGAEPSHAGLSPLRISSFRNQNESSIHYTFTSRFEPGPQQFEPSCIALSTKSPHFKTIYINTAIPQPITASRRSRE